MLRFARSLARGVTTILVAGAFLLTVLLVYGLPWSFDRPAFSTLEQPIASADFPQPCSPPSTCGPEGAMPPSPLEFDRLVLAMPPAAVEPTPGTLRAPLAPLVYRVSEGDTLLGIAEEFGITPETVLWANDLPNPQLLMIGQELTILPLSGVLHRTVPGDTVAAIAERYGADPALIRAANGFVSGQEPAPGQSLIVAGGMIRTPVVFEPPPTAPPPSVISAALRYTVKRGDNLVSIADAFGVRPSAIQAANGLMDPDLLVVGQELAIPGGKEPSSAPTPRPVTPTFAPARTLASTPIPPTVAATAPAAPTTGETTQRYTVKAGDTVASIARANGVSAASLAQANGLSDPNKLVVGQVLRIPAGSPVAAGLTPAAVSSPSLSPRPVSPTSTMAPVAPTATATASLPTPTAAPLPPKATVGPPTPAPPVPSRVAAPAPAPPSGSMGDRIALLAQKYLGYRYVWGGHAPSGFDCTGFTWYVYREAGLTIPMHDLPGQLGKGQKVAREGLLAGDLVFFENTYMKGLSHVGIYLGGGRFINAETEKTGVQIRSLSDPGWASRYVGASRPW